MKCEVVIANTRAQMMRGKRFKPSDITKYENAVRQLEHNMLLEISLLYFAEVLHDMHGFGVKRTRDVLREIDSRMTEWLSDDFVMDDLRERVFSKTVYMFAVTEEDQEHIIKMLEDRGYKIKDM